MLLIGYAIDSMLAWGDAPSGIALFANLYNVVFSSARNGLFEGFFYVAVGMAFGIGWTERARWSLARALAGIAVGLVACILINPDAHLPFCALLSVSLFALCIRRVSDTSHPWMRQASTIIYLVHMVFVVIFVYGICGHAEIGFFHAPIPHAVLYIFAVGCSLLVATIVIPLCQRFPSLKIVFGV